MAGEMKAQDSSEDKHVPEAKLRWEWTFSPQTIFAALNFIVLFLGVVGLWFKMQADVTAAKDTVSELKTAVTQLVQSQTAMVERMSKVETKVDIMLPLIQRTNEQTFAPRATPAR